MQLDLERSCDVLVVGSGIAGISAALAAAGMGRRVILTSSAHLFSGSSFYPGTWGLGLIGPADDADRQDLKDTVRAVGCGMANPAMVDTFVDGISPAIETVRAMGVKLRRADDGSQKEFIPCFDHKHRDWNGIEFDSARSVFSRRMDELGVTALPGCELLELVHADGRICGAVFAESGKPRYFGCKALVLATGGYGSIFQRHLCTEDVSALGQSLALRAGCGLVNMEFMQMMPGYICPAPKTVFNEKVFRFTRLHSPDGRPLLPDGPETAALLEERSTHGPFTSRLASREVDLAISRCCLSNDRGVTATYTEELRHGGAEFVKTYFAWLAEVKHLTPDDPIQLGIFAHAANGGIQILPDASTAVPGLFACGEVTGGMHGADRIGGLSTANGLVFGGKAGRSAGAFGAPAPPARWTFDPWETFRPQECLSQLRETMSHAAMVVRTGAGLNAALDAVRGLLGGLSRRPTGDLAAAAAARRLEGQLITAQCVLSAAALRGESRGSHYRADRPVPNPAMATPIVITQTTDGPQARFTKE